MLALVFIWIKPVSVTVTLTARHPGNTDIIWHVPFMSNYEPGFPVQHYSVEYHH